MRQIFDLPLFNEDGSFRENGGATKPTKIDADLTNWQNVVDMKTLETWIKLPTISGWINVDMPKLFSA
ncbi:MAG: hypothetical protein AAGF09_07065 [Pseudomonadota bacterium]